MACEKRGFTSASAARRANGHAGFRIRVYVCADCRRFHVANAEKRTSGHRKDWRRV